MPFKNDLIIISIFIALLTILTLLFRKYLNLNLREHFKPFKSKLLLSIFILLGLLLFRTFLTMDLTIFLRFPWIDKTLTILILIVLFKVASLFLDVLEASYNRTNYALRRPLRPLVQAIKILLIIILIFGIVAIVLEKDPLIVMGSISTILAFISFIFKDILLGFFAGIQLTTNDTIQIGDYISIPQLDVSGTVKSIGLTTTEITATNQTQITVSSYSLLQNPLINYRQLNQSEGRQLIKRFNFKMNNNLNIEQLENDIRKIIEQDTGINKNKVQSIQFEEGPMNNLTLVVNIFSIYPSYNEFDAWSTKFSLKILKLMATHACFE